MKEKRSEDRVGVSDEVEVVDGLSGGHLGLLGNVSAGGLMLITKTSFEIGGVVQLRLNFPEPVANRENLVVGAECVWIEPSTVQNTFFAGFSIVDIEADDNPVLEALCLP